MDKYKKQRLKLKINVQWA